VIPSDRQIHARFYVGGSDGITWHDLTDHLISADVDVGDVAQLGASGVDGVVRQADFTLWRRGTSYTLSNHRTGYSWSHYADDTWNILTDRTWEVLNIGATDPTTLPGSREPQAKSSMVGLDGEIVGWKVWL